MKKILIGLVVVLLVVAGVGFFTPKEYSVVKAIIIEAPPETVHRYVGNLEQWPQWAPWAEEDPSIVTTFGDRTSGVGAHQSWTSDDGDGDLTLTRSDPQTGIAYDMAFISDGNRFPATSSMEYKAVANGTEVSWTMEGTWKGMAPPVLDGWMKLLTPWMIGSSFDKGLANLKVVVEASG